jgi:hypothetical protein
VPETLDVLVGWVATDIVRDHQPVAMEELVVIVDPSRPIHGLILKTEGTGVEEVFSMERGKDWTCPILKMMIHEISSIIQAINTEIKSSLVVGIAVIPGAASDGGTFSMGTSLLVPGDDDMISSQDPQPVMSFGTMTC